VTSDKIKANVFDKAENQMRKAYCSEAVEQLHSEVNACAAATMFNDLTHSINGNSSTTSKFRDCKSRHVKHFEKMCELEDRRDIAIKSLPKRDCQLAIEAGNALSPFAEKQDFEQTANAWFKRYCPKPGNSDLTAKWERKMEAQKAKRNDVCINICKSAPSTSYLKVGIAGALVGGLVIASFVAPMFAPAGLHGAAAITSGMAAMGGGPLGAGMLAFGMAGGQLLVGSITAAISVTSMKYILDACACSSNMNSM